MPTQIESNTKQKQCVHHWIIDSAMGPTSFGRCKLCGVIAKFHNDWRESLSRIESPDGVAELNIFDVD